MKKKTTNSSNRRKFLSLGLLGGAALISQPAAAMMSIEPDDEMVPMLTPDGKLVQVRKRILDQTEDRRKAVNKDIFNWSSIQNKKDQ